jgi:hypothetical protein
VPTLPKAFSPAEAVTRTAAVEEAGGDLLEPEHAAAAAIRATARIVRPALLECRLLPPPRPGCHDACRDLTGDPSGYRRERPAGVESRQKLNPAST